MIYSLRSNARYQAIVLGSGILGLIYVFWSNGFKGQSVRTLIMALAYYLMGHGLVAIPRRLIKNANISGRLQRIQANAPKVHEKMEDSAIELEELEAQLRLLRQRKNGISRDHQEWVDELVEAPHEASRLSSRLPVPATAPAIPAVVTDRYLADLGRRLSRARHKRLRFIQEWDRLLQDAAETQMILDSQTTKQLDFGQSSTTFSRLSSTIITPTIRYHLHTYIATSLRLLLGFVFALASLCIIWSELIKFAAPSLSLISLSIIHHSDGKISLAGQLIACFWLFYMCAACLTSFSEVKVWGNRALVTRNTYPESACWYAGQIAKLTVPLAYNFLTFFPPAIHQKTTFYQFLGQYIILTPLGKGFDYFFPIFILLPVCATLFNLYGRIRSKIWDIDLVDEDDDSDSRGFGAGGWREGKALIERELSGRTTLNSSTALHSRSSSPLPSSARAAPSLYIPPASGSSNTPTLSRSPQRQSQAHSSRLAAATAAAAEQDDENVFAGFAHRVKNTLDGVDIQTPEWFGKRPKWMGGDGDSGSAAGGVAGLLGGGSSGGEGRRGLGRWFGGSARDGRVRL
jgi:uncharacterized membrane protein YgcG